MIYRIVFDHDHYIGAVIDSAHIEQLVGSLRGTRQQDRIDVHHTPKQWSRVFNEPIKLTFPVFAKTDKQKKMPDISELQGRLVLNEKAFSALHNLIENDGDTIPATYNTQKFYFYTPLRVAEEANAVNTEASQKNPWGDVEKLQFLEEKTNAWNLFRSEYSAFMTIYCNDAIKQIIEEQNIFGITFTQDLA